MFFEVLRYLLLIFLIIQNTYVLNALVKKILKNLRLSTRIVYMFILHFGLIFFTIFALGLLNLLYLRYILLFYAPLTIYFLLQLYKKLLHGSSNNGKIALKSGKIAIREYLSTSKLFNLLNITDRTEKPLALLYVCAITAVLGLMFIFAVRAPVTTSDMTFYHLPYVDQILQDHSINKIYNKWNTNILGFAPYVTGYPKAYEFLVAYIVIVLGHIQSVSIVGLSSIMVVLLTVYALLKHHLFGEKTGRLYILAAVSAVLSLPVIYMTLYIYNIDIFLLSLNLASLLVVLEIRDAVLKKTTLRTLPSHFFILGIVCGLAVATKFYAVTDTLLFAFILLLVLVFTLYKKIVHFLLCISVTGFVALCISGFFYINNYIRFHNPLYPYSILSWNGPVDRKQQYALEKLMAAGGSKGMADHTVSFLLKWYFINSFNGHYGPGGINGTLGSLWPLLFPLSLYALWRFRKNLMVMTIIIASLVGWSMSKTYVIWMVRYNLNLILLVIIISFLFLKKFYNTQNIYLPTTVFTATLIAAVLPIYILPLQIENAGKYVNYLSYVELLMVKKNANILTDGYPFYKQLDKSSHKILTFYQNEEYDIHIYYGNDFSRKVDFQSIDKFKREAHTYDIDKLYSYMKENKIDSVSVQGDNLDSIPIIFNCHKKRSDGSYANIYCRYSKSAVERYQYVTQSIDMYRQLKEDRRFIRLFYAKKYCNISTYRII